MSKSGTIGQGKTIHAKIGIRIRHVRVETVTNQDNLTARLGGIVNSILGFKLDDPEWGILDVRRLAYSSTAINIIRAASTKTRGTLFTQP